MPSTTRDLGSPKQNNLTNATSRRQIIKAILNTIRNSRLFSFFSKFRRISVCRIPKNSIKKPDIASSIDEEEMTRGGRKGRGGWRRFFPAIFGGGLEGEGGDVDRMDDPELYDGDDERTEDEVDEQERIEPRRETSRVVSRTMDRTIYLEPQLNRYYVVLHSNNRN
jgi:hypothetical protein